MIEQVMRRLPTIADERDREIVEITVRRNLERGWPIDEIVAFCRCLEHVDPMLPEELALARMRQVLDRVGWPAGEAFSI